MYGMLAAGIVADVHQHFKKKDIQAFQSAANAFAGDADERNSVQLLGKLFGTVGYLSTPEEIDDMMADAGQGIS
jgi:Ca2+-binding EF-hand superfamily protein